MNPRLNETARQIPTIKSLNATGDRCKAHNAGLRYVRDANGNPSHRACHFGCVVRLDSLEVVGRF